jgi:hypothetical protein
MPRARLASVAGQRETPLALIQERIEKFQLFFGRESLGLYALLDWRR